MSEKQYGNNALVVYAVRPTPIEKEVVWNKNETLLSKIDPAGLIEYANDAFMDVSGFEDYELINQAHTINQHPDMPKAIDNLIWENLRAGNKFHAVVKNLAKSGRYYWVWADYDIVRNNYGEITHYFVREKAVSSEVVYKHIEPLYKRLLNIERTSGVSASEKYLNGFWEETERDYLAYLQYVVIDTTPKIVEPELKQEIKKRSSFLNLFTF